MVCVAQPLRPYSGGLRLLGGGRAALLPPRAHKGLPRGFFSLERLAGE